MNLSNELSKHIILSISNIILDSNFKSNHIITLISDSEFEHKIPIYIAKIKINQSQDYIFLMCNVSEKNNDPIYFGLIQTNINLFGLILEENTGKTLHLINNKWIPISLLFQLNLTAGFEMIIQNGLSWDPCLDEKIIDELIQHLKNLIDQ